MQKMTHQEKIRKYKEKELENDWKYEKDGRFQVKVALNIIVDVKAKNSKDALAKAEKQIKKEMPKASGIQTKNLVDRRPKNERNHPRMKKNGRKKANKKNKNNIISTSNVSIHSCYTNDGIQFISAKTSPKNNLTII